MSEQNLKLTFNDFALEAEVKLSTDRATMDELLAFIETQGPPFIPEPVQRDERTNIYFDTKHKFHLFRRVVECRTREVSKRGETTFRYDVKTPFDLEAAQGGPEDDGIFLRREYDHKGADMSPSLNEFRAGDLAQYLKDLYGKKLVPWVKGHFTRSKFTFTPTGHPGALLEIAFERGAYASMDDKHRSDEIFMIELELKEGTREALVDATRQLQDRYPGRLNICVQTKGERGLHWLQDYMSQQQRENFQNALAERPRRDP
jgi:inorganic triphosphatase YgiF